MYRHGEPGVWPRDDGHAEKAAPAKDSADREKPTRTKPAPAPRCPEHPAKPSAGRPGRRRHRYRHFVRRIMSIKEADRRFWKNILPDLAETEEKLEKEEKDAKDEITITPEAAEKVEELTVSKLDMNIPVNTKHHHTTKYNPSLQPVLRRGQEVEITFTFDRAYRKDKDDLFFIFKADEGKRKNLYVEFRMDEEGNACYKTENDWGARILEAKDNTLKVEIYIPGNAVVGQWEMEVKISLVGKEDDYIFEYDRPIFILFNPWSHDDQVFYTGNMKDLEEYVLNQKGACFRGSEYCIRGSTWDYNQFKGRILEICMTILRKSFDFKMSCCMSDPVEVSRALSRIVNSCDNQGVLVGNWTGNYEGETAPFKWNCSDDILQKYWDDGHPVKYGQCWVFSHVLTAVCRALGLPCRSVTNFDSAHDTDNTCTIDDYVNEDGDKVDRNEDSVWNFHVWNEVWICRPDLHCSTYDGWHVIDATPQERSLGAFQCGPCPVIAVKQGAVNVGYDTAFVFSEVNADRVTWQVSEDGSTVVSENDKDGIGHCLSTKEPNGEAYDNEKPLDLTNEYKHKEGSKEEREAVERAVRYRKHGDKLYNECCELKVKIVTSKETTVGEDLVLQATVENLTTEDKKIKLVMAARTCKYWNMSRDDKHLAKERLPEQAIKAGETKTYDLTISPEKYMESLSDALSVYTYACATDIEHKMPYSAQKPIILKLPELIVKGPKKAKSGETLAVSVTITNVLTVPLTNFGLCFAGDLDKAPEDKNDLEQYGRMYIVNLPIKEFPPKETLNLTLKLVGKREPDDDECQQSIRFSFLCNELPTTVEAGYALKVEAAATATATATAATTATATTTATASAAQ